MRHRRNDEIPGLPVGGGSTTVPQTNGATRGILPNSLSESDPQSIPKLPPVDGLGREITTN